MVIDKELKDSNIKRILKFSGIDKPTKEQIEEKKQEIINKRNESIDETLAEIDKKSKEPYNLS